MKHRPVLILLAAGLVLGGGGIAYAATTAQTATCTASPAITDGASTQSIRVTCSWPKPAPVTSTVTSTVTQTVTASPTSNPTTTTAAPTTTTPAPTTTTVTPSPTTTTTAPVSTGFPDASNTGVPDGTTLTPWGGANTCYADQVGQVIDAKILNCDLVVQAAGVKVSRTQINGRLLANTDNNPTASVTVADSLIDGGQQETFPAVSYTGITLTRVEVIGGQHSVQCWQNCTVTDSWLHNQYLPASSAGHVNAFISNGGDGFTLRHNTLDCTVAPTANGGCTADLSLFGDFGPIANVTIDGNLFKAEHAGFCLQAGHNPGKSYPNATGVKVTNNVFEKVGKDTTQCGLYGPVTAYDPAASGNTWSGNTWVDGTTLNP